MERLWNGQIGSLGDVLGRLEGDVLGTSWGPIFAGWECDKSCNIGEYLENSNCKFRKKIVNKLVEKCTEIIEETRLVEKTLDKNENKDECSSCTVCRVLFWLFFIFSIINVGIGIYITYYKYMSRNKENVPKYDYTCQITTY